MGHHNTYKSKVAFVVVAIYVETLILESFRLARPAETEIWKISLEHPFSGLEVSSPCSLRLGVHI